MRPFLHCPEIDEEDEIQVEQVMECLLLEAESPIVCLSGVWAVALPG